MRAWDICAILLILIVYTNDFLKNLRDPAQPQTVTFLPFVTAGSLVFLD